MYERIWKTKGATLFAFFCIALFADQANMLWGKTQIDIFDGIAGQLGGQKLFVCKFLVRFLTLLCCYNFFGCSFHVWQWDILITKEVILRTG